MLSKDDPFYGAMLVESVRLHLGTIMAGQASEIFFSDMLRIIDAKVYLGYKTLKNKQAKLVGIKDFIHNVHYGLGVKDIATFLCALTAAAIKDKTPRRYGYQLIDWLKDQDPVFDFPPELFHYRRLLRVIARDRRASEKTKIFRFSVLKFLYQDHPHLLEQIGPGRKYNSIEQCYFEEGFSEKMTTLKPIKIFRNPTVHQVEQVAEILFERLGRGKTRVLISRLIQHCKNATVSTSGDGGSIPDMDAE